MTRTVAVALAAVLFGVCAASAAERVDAPSVSAMADAKVASLASLKSRLSSTGSEGRYALLKAAMDQMSDAEPDEVKAVRFAAVRGGQGMAPNLKSAALKLARADAQVDGFVATLVAGGAPIQLPAEADGAPAVFEASGPLPVAVSVAENR